MIQTNPSPTLDGLFRRVLARQPDALALLDPPNKSRLTGQTPKRLTFAEADRAISALAAHFIEAGLPANSVVAVQLPNTVDFMLTVLAAHRAGLIVALVPLLWRQAELTVALSRTGARAIVTAGKIDGVDHADLAMNAAVEAFSVRHVCGFGSDLPDGMASLDQAIAKPSTITRTVTQDGRRAALISFDVTAEGFRAVPRSHLSLVAGGLAVFLESALPLGTTILSAFAPSSFAGLASSLVAWLLAGGTLALHHPFDGEVLEQQINDDGCDTLVAPAPLVMRLAEIEMAARLPTLRRVIGLWRAPEQIASSAPWTVPQAALTDVYLFGEAGLFGARRAADGTSAAILPGPHGAPRDIAGSSIAGETLITPHGTLALRGPMVTVAAYAPALLGRRSTGDAAAARLCRHRLRGATRSFDRRDLHHRPSSGHHGRRRIPVSVAGPAAMDQATGPGRAADRVAGPAERAPSRRPRPGQCPRPRRARRTGA